jgi:cyclic pyranopterin phosphate synthase
MSVPGVDTLGRPLTDLRISVTDRCNLRCTYCMPAEVYDGHRFLPKREILDFEELVRVARIFTRLGVRKLRLTGGEPLLRRDLPRLVESLAALPGIDDLALTTNGLLLPVQAAALRAAGLRRLTISLDALDDEIFGRMNGRGVSVAEVLAGIAAAEQAGFARSKINAVIERGVNDGEIVKLAERFRGTGHVLRFIEFMDVGTSNGWKMERVVPAAEIVRAIDARFPLEPLARERDPETALRFRYRDGGGEIGIIASVTQPFCGACSRARLSAKGELFTCLFAARGFDLRALLRGGASDAEIEQTLRQRWQVRDDRYSELRTAATTRGGSDGGAARVEMSYIGG